MSTPSEGVLTKPTPAVGTLLAVLGVVYGDIGTSPLYAMRASIGHFGNVIAHPTLVGG